MSMGDTWSTVRHSPEPLSRKDTAYSVGYVPVMAVISKAFPLGWLPYARAGGEWRSLE